MYSTQEEGKGTAVLYTAIIAPSPTDKALDIVVDFPLVVNEVGDVSSDKLYAFDAATRELKWSAPAGSGPLMLQMESSLSDRNKLYAFSFF